MNFEIIMKINGNFGFSKKDLNLNGKDDLILTQSSVVLSFLS